MSDDNRQAEPVATGNGKCDHPVQIFNEHGKLRLGSYVIKKGKGGVHRVYCEVCLRFYGNMPDDWDPNDPEGVNRREQEKTKKRRKRKR